jgi:hypothetical protein
MINDNEYQKGGFSMSHKYSVFLLTQLSHFYHFLAMLPRKLRMKGVLSSALCYTSLLAKSLKMTWKVELIILTSFIFVACAPSEVKPQNEPAEETVSESVNIEVSEKEPSLQLSEEKKEAFSRLLDPAFPKFITRVILPPVQDRSLFVFL